MDFFKFLLEDWNRGIGGKIVCIIMSLLTLILFIVAVSGTCIFFYFIYQHSYNRIDKWKPTAMTITSQTFHPENTHWSSATKTDVTDPAYYEICGTFPIDDGIGHTVGQGCLDITEEVKTPKQIFNTGFI